MYRIHRAVHWASLDAYIRSLGPAAWFRMDQGVTVTGAGISQVDDLSGNARPLLDPGTTRPIYLPYSGTKYLYLPGVAGNYASTPDSVANSITGDIDIRVRVALDDWTPASNKYFVSKWTVTGDQRGWVFGINATGKVDIFQSTGGTAGTIALFTSTTATGIPDGEARWVRVTLDVDNGSAGRTATFYTAADSSVEPTSWTQLGASVVVATAANTFDSSAGIVVGSIDAGTGGLAAGRFYRAIIKNGIDGTTVVDFNPADASDGATSFASSATGETWTVNSSGVLPAQIVGRASALFNGTSHYLKCNAFTLNQPTCVLWVGKQVSWTAFDYFCDGNTGDSAIIRQVTATPQVGIYAGTSLGNVSLTLSSLGVIAAVFNGASSSVRLNKGSPVSGNAGAGNPGGFTLGAAGNAGNPSNIQVYETVIFPIAPSTAQLDRLVAGLMARHSIS